MSQVLLLIRRFVSEFLLIKNLEIGDSYLISLDTKGNQKKEIFKKKDSELPIPMPGTGIISGNSIMFGLMSSNMKDYQFQTLSTN